MSKRKTPDDYHRLAESREFEWIGKYPGDVRVKTKWRCSQNHTWMACFDHLRRAGCPYCAGNARKVPDDYVKLGLSRGFEWIGPVVTNARTKTKWKCQKGHIFESRFDQIRKGNGCPYCAGVMRKTKKDYFLLAESNDIQWIGNKLPKNTFTKTKWQCSEGHVWSNFYQQISRGVLCPYCSGMIPKTAEDYHALARARDHEWIANEIPKGIHSVTTWRCSSGHIRKTCYNNVKKFGCPKCLDMVNGVLVSRPQRELHKMIGGDLNYIYGRYRIDIALPKEKIAIEYDGWFWHGDKRKHDKRDEYMLARGWKLLRIKSDTQLPSRQEIENAINQLMAGKKKMEIILDDWGNGRTFSDIKDSFRNKSSYHQLELF